MSRKEHEKLNCRTLEELQSKIKDLSLNIGLSEDLSPLKEPLKIGSYTFPNRLVLQPMEGCDSNTDGSPSVLTIRRYKRFGGSGAGLCWFEANTIMKEARANPRQMALLEENKNTFVDLIKWYKHEEDLVLKEIEQKTDLDPLPSKKILQITHSGRYAIPELGFKNPMRMYHYDPLDKAYGETREDGRILTDEELDALPELFMQSAKLAKEVGFDGVDIKSCHRYLLSETLSAFTRENSKYGGEDYDARTKLIKDIITPIQNKLSSPDFLITLRMNIYDAIPYPYGWGVKKENYKHGDPTEFTNRMPLPEPDLTEPIRFLNDLYRIGIRLANLSIANPYFNPFISRPYNIPMKGKTLPHENPLVGIERFNTLTGEVKKNVPDDMNLIGSGYSFLRKYGANYAAYQIKNGITDMAGWGRMGFANPYFAKQILINNEIDDKNSCLACSKCTELMRFKTVTGCVIRDRDTYIKHYKTQK